MFPAKYRRKVFTPSVAETLKKVSIGIEDCGYGIRFVEIGMEEDHVHMLVQSVPSISVTKIVTTIKTLQYERFLNNIHK